MPPRRCAAATVLLALLLATAGCLAAVTGTRPVRATATPPSVDDAVLGETGYELEGTESVRRNRTFSVAGQPRTAVVTSHVAEYGRSVDLGPLGELRAATFAVIATPRVTVLGRPRNPVGEMSAVELVGAFGSQFEGVTVGPAVGTRNATMLGEETTVTKLDGRTDVGPTTIAVYILVARVRHDGDYVLAFAVHPQVLSGEESAVLTLLRGVEH